MSNTKGVVLQPKPYDTVPVVHRLERGSLVLYPLMIAVGLFIGAISFMLEPRPSRLVGFALSAASFFVAALAAMNVLH